MKYGLFLLAFAGVLLAGTAHAQSWEYKVTEVDLISKIRVFANDLLLSADELEEQLAPLGEDGWELISTVPQAGGTQVLLVFKRPVQAPAAPAPAPALAPAPTTPSATESPSTPAPQIPVPESPPPEEPSPAEGGPE